MGKKKSFKWEAEFRQFMNEGAEAPARELSSLVQSRIEGLLHPKVESVFLRVLVIHLFSGAFTLLFCPQFGVGPLGGGQGFMAFFMKGGSAVCALSCGALFLGVTALVLRFFLTKEERRVLYRSRLWQFPAVAVVSVIVLMLVSTLHADSFAFPGVDFIFFWFLGAIGTALGILRIDLGYNGVRRSH